MRFWSSGDVNDFFCILARRISYSGQNMMTLLHSDKCTDHDDDDDDDIESVSRPLQWIKPFYLSIVSGSCNGAMFANRWVFQHITIWKRNHMAFTPLFLRVSVIAVQGSSAPPVNTEKSNGADKRKVVVDDLAFFLWSINCTWERVMEGLGVRGVAGLGSRSTGWHI